jgi:hypothetical protein
MRTSGFSVIAALALLPGLAVGGCREMLPETGGTSHDASSITATLLPESFELGGSAGGAIVTTSELDGTLTAEVTLQDASGLRACYLEIAYDPALWTPSAIEPTGALGGGQLALGIAGDPGRAYAGQVLAHPAQQPGFSGTAVMARVTFVPAAGARPLRAASEAPTSGASAARLAFDANEEVLLWHYSMQADYDQNGEVNIADLTPIGQNFKAVSGGGPFPYESIESVVDGDGNGEINIADITPIGQNFGRRVDAYNVYGSDIPADVPLQPGDPSTVPPLGSVPYSAGEGVRSQERLRYSFDLGGDTGMGFYWVRPADGADEGTPSNTVSHTIPSGPTIDSLTANPAAIAPQGTSTLTAVVTAEPSPEVVYTWSASVGSVTPGAPGSATYTAPDTDVELTAVITLQVEQDFESSLRTVDIVITPEPNNPPVINAIIANPDPVPSEGEADVVAEAVDPDGDDLVFTWTADDGVIISSAGGLALYTAPEVNIDTEIEIQLLVEDGRGGSDSETYTITVAEPVPDALSHIEVHPDDLFKIQSGSGTEADPWVIDQGSIRILAMSNQGFDWTAVPGVVFKHNKVGFPGLGFDTDPGEEGEFTTGQFFTGAVELWAEGGSVVTDRLYFDVEGGGPGG